MSFNRTLGNLGKAIDSASAGTFLQRDDATDVDFVSIEYSDLSGTPTALDSAAATNLIDSAYIQLRQGDLGGGGLDSAAVTVLADSSYVAARTTNLSSGFFMYDYVATAGQTTFQDSDANGNVLSYGNGGILVFYNGILMRRGLSYDYVEPSASAITLNTAADSAANITIAKWTYDEGSIDILFTWGGDRGIAAGGQNSGTRVNTINYFDITTAGNATDFGDLTATRTYSGGLSNSTRVLISGGNAGSGQLSSIDYITVATPSNASNFGNLTVARNNNPAGCCDGTYGVFSGDADDLTMDYVIVDTTGNATDFGDTLNDLTGTSGGNDGTRGLWCGDAYSTNIEYITIATPGNAADFGDQTLGRYGCAVAGDLTYVCMMGGIASGSVYSNTVDYVTVQTISNATDFGDLTVGRWMGDCGASNSIRGCATGGVVGSNYKNIIDYITIATPGNATDLGDLLYAPNNHAGSSGSPS